MVVIVPFDEKYLPEMREIFFETSTKKVFRSPEEREEFFYKYLGLYLSRFPELCFVAVEKDQVLGYVALSPLSRDEEFYQRQPHLQCFEKQFENYPAHLHINCHSQSRGQGVGRKLIEKGETALKTLNICGLHIMTSPDAENCKFYKKLGFNDEVIEDFRGSRILFMGKRIDSDSL